MTYMKLIIFLVCTLSVQLNSSQIKSKKTRVRLTKMICETSNQTVLQNISCRIRTNKKQSLLTISATFLRKVKNAKLTFESYRKYMEGYQRMIHLKDIEACKFIRNIENTSMPFIQGFIDQIKSTAKGNYMSVCDTIGDIYLINATFDSLPMLNYFPEGEYKLNYLIFDELDSRIGNITAISILTK